MATRYQDNIVPVNDFPRTAGQGDGANSMSLWVICAYTCNGRARWLSEKRSTVFMIRYTIVTTTNAVRNGSFNARTIRDANARTSWWAAGSHLSSKIDTPLEPA